MQVKRKKKSSVFISFFYSFAICRTIVRVHAWRDASFWSRRLHTALHLPAPISPALQRITVTWLLIVGLFVYSTVEHFPNILSGNKSSLWPTVLTNTQKVTRKQFTVNVSRWKMHRRTRSGPIFLGFALIGDRPENIPPFSLVHHMHQNY